MGGGESLEGRWCSGLVARYWHEERWVADQKVKPGNSNYRTHCVMFLSKSRYPQIASLQKMDILQ